MKHTKLCVQKNSYAIISNSALNMHYTKSKKRKPIVALVTKRTPQKNCTQTVQCFNATVSILLYFEYFWPKHSNTCVNTDKKKYKLMCNRLY